MSYPVWIDDARTATARLGDALRLLGQARDEANRWPFDSWNDDLESPRAWLLRVASTQLSFARFYLGLAADQ